VGATLGRVLAERAGGRPTRKHTRAHHAGFISTASSQHHHANSQQAPDEPRTLTVTGEPGARMGYVIKGSTPSEATPVPQELQLPAAEGVVHSARKVPDVHSVVVPPEVK
jgi:hypothetical protein